MAANPNFEDRMFMEGQAIYDAISRGEVQDVEAALMDAHVRASEDDES
ncbi:hypothetical protein ACFVZD_47105 [Streptomyces sp. NPDC058287]